MVVTVQDRLRLLERVMPRLEEENSHAVETYGGQLKPPEIKLSKKSGAGVEPCLSEFIHSLLLKNHLHGK